MKRFSRSSVLAVFFVLVLVGVAMAADTVTDYGKVAVICASVFTAGLAIGLAAFGVGLGMGEGLSGALNSIGRNPEASGKIMVALMVGLAMLESLAIYALVVSLILLFVSHPLLKFVGMA